MGLFFLHVDFTLVDQEKRENILQIVPNSPVKGAGPDLGRLYDAAPEVKIPPGGTELRLPANDCSPFEFGFTITRSIGGHVDTWDVPTQDPGVTVNLTDFTPSNALPMTPSEFAQVNVALTAEIDRATTAEEDLATAQTEAIAAAINALVAGAPGALDTLNEIASRLATDESAASAILATLSGHIADHANPHAVTKAQVGLSNVDNTSDANKPVSTAQATAITTAINNLVNGAPGALDTLKEISDQLASDESAAGAITTLVTAIRNLTDSTFAAALSASTVATMSDAQMQKSGAAGFLAIEPEGSHGVSSVLGQAAGTMRFRWTRGGTQDTVYVPNGYGEHFLINRYAYGMAWQYAGFTQFNTACFAVGAMEPYTAKPGPYGPGWGGVIVAFNQADSGGLFMTYRSDGNAGTYPADNARGELAVQSYPGNDGGPLHFVTRGNSGWVWKTGVYGAETQHTTLGPTGAFTIGADAVAAAGQLTVYPRFFGSIAAVFYGKGGDVATDIQQWNNAATGSLAKIKWDGTFTTKGSVGAGDVVTPLARLHVADFGGVAARIHDTNTSTGGASSLAQVGKLMTVNVYGPTGTFAGTPIKWSDVGVGFNNNAPVAKAAHPTTLADVIAILQNVGLCA